MIVTEKKTKIVVVFVVLYKVCKESGRNFTCFVPTDKERLFHVLVNLGLSVLETLFSATLAEPDFLHLCCFFVCAFLLSFKKKNSPFSDLPVHDVHFA